MALPTPASSGTPSAGLHALPYFAPARELPSPLPTREEIENAADVLKDGHGCRVVRVKGDYVVKYGEHVNLKEGLKILFVQEKTDLVVPQVFALYSKQDASGSSVAYIVMEYICGPTLESIWPKLGRLDKVDLALNMRATFDCLRSLPSPGYFGGIGQQPVEDGLFWQPTESGNKNDNKNVSDTAKPGPATAGPFSTEAQLNEALVAKYRHDGGMDTKADYYQRVMPKNFQGHRPMFTHGNFQRKHVLIGPGRTIILVDWKAAGWYPSYWEYASAMMACDWEDHWHASIALVLDEHPNAYAWLDMMKKECSS